jgi:hypothetical protein
MATTKTAKRIAHAASLANTNPASISKVTVDGTGITVYPKRKPSAKQLAFQFFLAHAGYSYDPTKETERQGRARCARQLAKAESDASRVGIHFRVARL